MGNNMDINIETSSYSDATYIITIIKGIHAMYLKYETVGHNYIIDKENITKIDKYLSHQEKCSSMNAIETYINNYINNREEVK